MAVQMSSAELIDRAMTRDSAIRSVALRDMNLTYDDRPLAPARGIILAVLISMPMWGLFAFMLHKLL